MLDESLLRGMKEKKVREVAPLAAVVASVAHSCGATLVVDWLVSFVWSSLGTPLPSPATFDSGSGHGHLARVLAYQYGLHVVGLDCSEYHATQAQLKTVGLLFFFRLLHLQPNSAP
jgi:hypothetical protein